MNKSTDSNASAGSAGGSAGLNDFAKRKPFKLSVNSETGPLEGVILHTPGPEIENMTPKNVKRTLYSDILNLSEVSHEYAQISGVLNKITKVFYVTELLMELLSNEKEKENLISTICKNEDTYDIIDDLLSTPAKELASMLIEGVVMKKNNLTRFLSKDYYSIRPLHNFFYTRDSATVISDQVFIGSMAGQVRKREAMIMESIFSSHPMFCAYTIDPISDPMVVTGHDTGNIIIEGGDILVIREDVLVIGIGGRTTSQGVDFIIRQLSRKKEKKHIIVQELPESPESFIHLDMVFTMLDQNICMVYEPVILKPNKYQTVHITLDNGNVTSIKEERNLPETFRSLGLDITPVICGGRKDTWVQQREQWHSGANFFAVGPGKVIGYGRNVHTIEEMNNHGFEVIEAGQIIKNKINIDDYEKYVITVDGAELARGGGGCRCMTMPVRRGALT